MQIYDWSIPTPSQQCRLTHELRGYIILFLSQNYCPTCVQITRLSSIFFCCFSVWKCRFLKRLSLPKSSNFVTLCKYEFWRQNHRHHCEPFAKAPVDRPWACLRPLMKVVVVEVTKWASIKARHDLLPDNIACPLTLYNIARERLNTA
jgi:hypothetical protein